MDNYVAELQAAAESYTDDDYAAKKAERATKIAQLQAKDELAAFNMVTLDYKKDLKQQSKRNTLSDADILILEEELADIVEERSTFQDAVPTTKKEHSEAKKQSAEERKELKNGKGFSQPVNAKVDDNLKKSGIDQATMSGGAIEGNGAQKLETCDAIITEIEESTRIAGIDTAIQNVGKTHPNLVTCLDGFFSLL